jgi:hypothetical protein
MSVVELGGARVSEATGGAICSANQVRRMLAGELVAEELVLAEAHVAGCTRCQAVRAEVEQERAALVTAMPFESFAAGVAEKLAREGGAQAAKIGAMQSRRRRWKLVTGMLAVAASLAFAGLYGLSLWNLQHPSNGYQAHTFSRTTTLADWQRLRSKGGAGISVFALRAARSFALREDERSEPGDRLLPALEPAGHANVIVALIEGSEVSLLYRGPARAGPLPEAFEWTGAAPEARLVAVYADQPLDGDAVIAALRDSRRPSGEGVELVERRLSR